MVERTGITKKDLQDLVEESKAEITQLKTSKDTTALTELHDLLSNSADSIKSGSKINKAGSPEVADLNDLTEAANTIDKYIGKFLLESQKQGQQRSI